MKGGGGGGGCPRVGMYSGLYNIYKIHAVHTYTPSCVCVWGGGGGRGVKEISFAHDADAWENLSWLWNGVQTDCIVL